MFDPSHIAPFRQEHTKILNGILGKASVRITVEEALVNKTWRKCDSNVDLSGLDQKWKEDMTKGGSHVLQDTWVTATDPHYDAMLFPCLHPYGTGSLWAEPSAGGTNAIPRLCKSRLLSSKMESQSKLSSPNLYLRTKFCMFYALISRLRSICSILICLKQDLIKNTCLS